MFVSPSPHAGTPQYTHNLLNALADRGHTLALLGSVNYELAEYRRRYRLVEAIDRYHPSPSRFLAIARLVQELKPEIIHFQGAQQPAGYLAIWFALRTFSSARFVYTPQDVLPFREGRYSAAILRILYGRMSHVFLNAKQNRNAVEQLFGVDGSKISVLPMPDLLDFVRRDVTSTPPELPEDRCLILFFGQIMERKGVDTLLDAFARVVRMVPNIHLAIVGKAHMSLAPLEQQIRSLGISESVTLRPGYASFSEMAGYFERAHIVALPYRHGWNSGVLGSSFGYGKPVVATRVGGFEEVVVDGYNGLLVPPEDPHSLASAIERCVKSASLYQSLTEGARETSERSSWAEVARLTECRYREVWSRDNR